MVKKLSLNKPIICGASMAGQICLAVAVRADEVGAGGTIPLQGSDYLNMERQWNDRSPYVNQSLFNPEWIYGMMSPTAPLQNRQLVWHLYSAQAYGIFHGDLDFCTYIDRCKHHACLRHSLTLSFFAIRLRWLGWPKQDERHRY